MHFFGNIITYSTISRIELVHFRIITSKISEFRLLKINNNISNMREKIAGNLFTRFNGFFFARNAGGIFHKKEIVYRHRQEDLLDYYTGNESSLFSVLPFHHSRLMMSRHFHFLPLITNIFDAR